MVDLQSYKLAAKISSIKVYTHASGGHLGYVYQKEKKIYLDYLEDLLIEIIKNNVLN